MKKGILIFFLIAFLPTLLLSETIVLKDGRRIETQGTWEKDGLIKYFKDGKIAAGIPREKVKRIERRQSEGKQFERKESPKTIGIEEFLNTDDESYRILVLKNGRKIKTLAIWEEDGLIKFSVAGGTLGIRKEEVKAVEKDPSLVLSGSRDVINQNDYYYRTYEFTDHRNAQCKVDINILKRAVVESESQYKNFFKVYRRVSNVKYTLPDYREIQRWQSNMLKGLYGKMKQLAMQNRMNEREFTILLARFVQHLTYKIPPSYGGFWPPVVCLKEKAGDCDSKSTLFATLFYHFKKNSCILILTKQHAFIGIKNQHKVFPTDGVVKIGGIDYLLLEATGIHRLGYISKRELAYLKQGRFKYIPFY